MLTPIAQNTHLSSEQARAIFQKWVAIHSRRRSHPPDAPPAAPEDSPDPPTPTSYKEEMLLLLQGLTPAAFERFCADLLTRIFHKQFEIGVKSSSNCLIDKEFCCGACA